MLEQFTIAENLYLLGTFEKGLTIYNQQVRALNLVWAMIEEVPKEVLQRVAVIGGGFAGLTAAIGLLQKGVEHVSVFEKRTVEVIYGFLKQMPQCFDPAFETWSREYLESLERFYISKDVLRLEGLGLSPQALAVAIKAIALSPSFDQSFACFGNKRQRKQKAKQLLTPLPVLPGLAKIFGDIPPLMMGQIPSPSHIASELRILSSMLSWSDLIYNSLGTNSLLEASKFGLAGLVRGKTGNYLDREVSNLTYAALNDPNYDENRHRVWRISNYSRLQQNVPFIQRFLLALNDVVSLPKCHKRYVAARTNFATALRCGDAGTSLLPSVGKSPKNP